MFASDQSKVCFLIAVVGILRREDEEGIANVLRYRYGRIGVSTY